MSDHLDNEHFDTLIVGTGATESIIANELSAAGHKVLHIDRNSYYGGPNACFSLSGFLTWTLTRDFRQVPQLDLHIGNGLFAIDKPGPIESLTAQLMTYHKEGDLSTAQETLDGLLANDRAYMVEPVPKLVLCRGNMIDLLVDQGVGDFMRFRGVDHNYLVTRQGLERVPESKEDIFASTSLTLVEKRKLMRLMTTLGANLEKPEGSFSQLLAQQFKLTGKLHDTVLYAVARQTGYELSAQEGCDRVYKYVNSIGRYGRMAYLCAQYGGGSEIAQSFCRLCAVTGGTYILDEKLECIEPNEDGFKVSLRRGTAQVSRIVMDPGYYSPNSAALDSVVSRAVCILDNPVLGTDTTCVLTFLDEGSVVSLLYVTSATMAVPEGQALMYAWTEGTIASTKPLLQRAVGVVAQQANVVLSVFFEVRELTAPATDGIFYTSQPDTSVDFESTYDAAQQVLSMINKPDTRI